MVGDDLELDHGNSPSATEVGMTRRRVLASSVGLLVTGLAGCMGSPAFSDADIIAGPNGDFRFQPDELRVDSGETVRWGFASAGHSVCAKPSVSDEVSIPSGADGFASFGPNESPHGTLVPRGETYERTLDVSGRYTYVCVPHVSAGMIAEIVVE